MFARLSNQQHLSSLNCHTRLMPRRDYPLTNEQMCHLRTVDGVQGARLGGLLQAAQRVGYQRDAAVRELPHVGPQLLLPATLTQPRERTAGTVCTLLSAICC